MKSAVGLASMALVVGQAGLATAFPSCSREASQLTAVFSDECTQWFQKSGRRKGEMPQQCNQVGRGLVPRGVVVEDTVPLCIFTSEYIYEQVFVLFLCAWNVIRAARGS